MPHDVDRHLDHNPVCFSGGWPVLILAGRTLNDSSSVHGAIERLSVLYCDNQSSQTLTTIEQMWLLCVDRKKL